MNIEGGGSMEDQDCLNVYCRVDGGSLQVLSENVNALEEKVISVTGVISDTQVRSSGIPMI